MLSDSRLPAIDTSGYRVTTTALIAIVDDDAAVRDALGRLVRSFDLPVVLYPGGQALLDAAALGTIACVISDVQMPGMSGFAMCEALRALDLHVPVIFMTAFAHDGDEQRARLLGSTCFLNKPFQDIELLHCIERALTPRQ